MSRQQTLDKSEIMRIAIELTHERLAELFGQALREGNVLADISRLYSLLESVPERAIPRRDLPAGKLTIIGPNSENVYLVVSRSRYGSQEVGLYYQDDVRRVNITPKFMIVETE